MLIKSYIIIIMNRVIRFNIVDEYLLGGIGDVARTKFLKDRAAYRTEPPHNQQRFFTMTTTITETPKTSKTSDTVERHIAFKFPLKPTQEQLEALARDGRASRYAYNMLVGYNAEVMRTRNEYWAKRQEEGASDDDIKAELKTLAKEDPKYKTLGYMAFGKMLTAEVARHRACAKAIKDGTPLEEVWGADERSKAPWLHTAKRRVLSSGTQSADKALKNFFDSRTGKRAGNKMGAPKFKSRATSNDSYTIFHPEVMGGYGTELLLGEPAYKVAKANMKRRSEKGRPTITDYRHVRLGHLGTLRIHGNTRRMMRAIRKGGIIKSFTVSQVADRWNVSFLVATTVPATKPTRKQKEAGAIGVDLGVKYMAALSDTDAPRRFHNDSGVNFTNGTNPTVENPRWIKHAEKRITKLQQKIARQVKGSNRRKANVRKLAKTHHLVALRRETGLHQLTKNLTTRYTLIGIEDLNVSGMTASASGTIENPGKNVTQKAGLNRAMLDVAFGTFRTQLEYKAAWYGSRVQPIGRYYPSSQACSNCGKRPETKLTLSDRTYKCEHCHTEIDRDLNAAINIKREAERLYAEA